MELILSYVRALMMMLFILTILAATIVTLASNILNALHRIEYKINKGEIAFSENTVTITYKDSK